MLWTAFVLGLAGSFHCIGMCGPIAFVLPIDKTSKARAIYQSLLYHFGRLLSYSLIGFFFGFIGKGLYLAGFQQRLSILIGVLMIFIVLIPVKIFNKYNFSKPLYQIIGVVKQRLGLYLSKKSNKSIFLIGFFNGFLPCGLVYMALIGSIATGEPLEGALYMALFGLGTVPLMSVAIFLGNVLNLTVRKKIQKAIPIFIVIIGLLFILRGLGLGIPYISPSDAKLQISNNPADCVTVENE
ncbi:MAG: sulfite exporter TauE/SafE family protein [Lutibacter sp.]|nr:sulfite exporter TauE/SafE family protein [Lutibacter sp.]MBP9601403.1 sulfite exporter TauE/SafE family protein [Lutibacter sp.]